MDIRIKKIHVFSKYGEETVYDFANSLTFIYGNIGAGKTTLLNLIMYCLGSKLVVTPAIDIYLDSVQLEVLIRGDLYKFFRKVNSNRIFVQDIKFKQNFRFISADISDYIFHKCGLSTIYQAIGEMAEKKIKLTYVNFSWFSYLKQLEMDNNFFHLDSDNTFKKIAAENVLLTLLQSNVLIDQGLNEKYRINKRKTRQYEEGTQIFDYLDKALLSENVGSISEKINLINGLYNKINQLKEKKNLFSINELEQFINMQKQIDAMEYECIYLKKKENYFNALDKLKSEGYELKKKLKDDLSSDEINVSRICDLFLECLREVGFQGVSKYDKIIMEGENHYIPMLYNRFNQQKISFQNLGSGGKKTIFKICFALSLYRYHASDETNCYLPGFLMIDTPMKNISEREDEQMYIRFYSYLFRLFSTELKNIQLIVVDKEEKDIKEYKMKDDAVLMKMTRDDPLNPPLFQGYKEI